MLPVFLWLLLIWPSWFSSPVPKVDLTAGHDTLRVWRYQISLKNVCFSYFFTIVTKPVVLWFAWFYGSWDSFWFHYTKMVSQAFVIIILLVEIHCFYYLKKKASSYCIFREKKLMLCNLFVRFIIVQFFKITQLYVIVTISIGSFELYKATIFLLKKAM